MCELNTIWDSNNQDLTSLAWSVKTNPLKCTGNLNKFWESPRNKAFLSSFLLSSSPFPLLFLSLSAKLNLIYSISTLFLELCDSCRFIYVSTMLFEIYLGAHNRFIAWKILRNTWQYFYPCDNDPPCSLQMLCGWPTPWPACGIASTSLSLLQYNTRR